MRENGRVRIDAARAKFYLAQLTPAGSALAFWLTLTGGGRSASPGSGHNPVATPAVYELDLRAENYPLKFLGPDLGSPAGVSRHLGHGHAADREYA